MTFSKEQAGMVYLAVFDGECSKLRNSLSRREFFREGNDYYRVFNLRGDEAGGQPGPLPDGFTPDERANLRALRILAARVMEEECRKSIGSVGDKRERGSLRKGAYYLARIIYLKQSGKIDQILSEAAGKDRKAAVSRGVIDSVVPIARTSMEIARNVFAQALKDYLSKEGGNEDAALKNSAFAKLVDEYAVR